MIDYDKPDEDPIVAEVRRAREEIAAQFNYDLRAIFQEYQRRQVTSGHAYASPSQRSEESPPTPSKKAG